MTRSPVLMVLILPSMQVESEQRSSSATTTTNGVVVGGGNDDNNSSVVAMSIDGASSPHTKTLSLCDSNVFISPTPPPALTSSVHVSQSLAADTKIMQVSSRLLGFAKLWGPTMQHYIRKTHIILGRPKKQSHKGTPSRHVDASDKPQHIVIGSAPNM
jgi:hypothetical protein